MGIIVGADVGNQDSKFYSGGKSIVIPSYACQERLREIDNITEEYHLRINGKMWWTGDLARMEYGSREIEKNKLMRDSNLPLLLTGISLLMAEQPELLVSVVGGTPISDYSDCTLTLREIIKNTWNTEICGKRKTMHIIDVLTMPEGASVGFYLVLDDKGKAHSKPDVLRIIDIGSKTINFASFRKMRYIASESGTLPFGTTSAQIETYKRVASKIDILPDEVKPDDESLYNLSVRARSEINKWWRSWDEVNLAGGGAELLRDILPYPVVPNPQIASAIGNYRVGMNKWAQGQ